MSAEAFVMVVRCPYDGSLAFRPSTLRERVVDRHGDDEYVYPASIRPLAWGDDGEPVQFDELDRANAAADSYNIGPEYEARSATWTGEHWEVTEYFPQPLGLDPDREDFHADG